MRGMVAVEPGGVENLRLVELPVPSPGDGELLVRVKALGLNPLDTKVRKGYRAEGRSWPLLLGWDVAGVVEGVGAGVDEFRPGDEVFYCADITGPGASADYHVVDHRLAAPKPSSLSFVEAASLPLAGSTALQALERQAKVAMGETLVVFGAAGGVGGVAVMIARSLGARVIGVCSGANVPYVASLGADEVIDYTADDPVGRIMALTGGKGADVVFDTVGGVAFRQGMAVLAPFGRLLFLNAFPSDAGSLAELNPMRLKNGGLHCVMVVPSGDLMRELSGYIAKDIVKPHVDEELPLHRLADGHARLERGHGRGKVVVDLTLQETHGNKAE